MFRLVTILLLITKHTLGQASSICAEVPNNNYVRSSQSCNSYNKCVNGQPTFGVCPKGFSFSPLTQMCDHSIDVNCRLCSPFGIQNIPEPDSCYFYYRCTNGVPTTMFCFDGLLFDRKIGDCNFAERVICETKNTICEPFASLGKVLIGNSMDCSSYYQCVNGNAYESVCPNGLLYNPHTANCEPRGTTNFCQGVGPIITTPIPVEPTTTTSEPTAKSSVRIVYMKRTTTAPVTTTRAATTTVATTATTTVTTTVITSTSVSTEPPVTEPPVTDPPVTEPPVTEPPVTEPPATEPPVTEPPAEPPVTEPQVTAAPPPVLTCETGVTGYFPFPPPNNCVRYYYCSRGLLRFQLTCNPPQFFTPGDNQCSYNVPPECEHLLPQTDDA